MDSGLNNLDETDSVFDAIRSFNDTEVSSALAQLTQNSKLLSVFGSNSSGTQIETSQLKTIKTITEFQAWMQTLVRPILSNTVTSLHVSGLEMLQPDQSHIFISNHRDIIMDPLLINVSLLDNGFQSAHCAIGDNLLNTEASRLLSGLNNCFKVVRSLTSPKAMLKAMKLQSEYIRHLHFQKNQQVWIAQKEGRAKDNKDLTNPALIKMLSLAKDREVAPNDYLSTLNIVPVSISYEWDPCDTEKAIQLSQKANSSNYQKHENDDIQAIQKGLFGNKGRISVAFGEVIKPYDTSVLNRYEVANRIDTFIHKHYRIFESNFAAYELLGADSITLSEIEETLNPKEIINARESLLRRTENLETDVRQRLLHAYAEPFLAKYKEQINLK